MFVHVIAIGVGVFTIGVGVLAIGVGVGVASSVHPLAAVHGSTVTRDFVLVILEVELVVVAQLETQEVKKRLRDWP